VDPGASERLLPRLENDPGVEIRREAVARLLRRAGALREGKDPGALNAFRRCLVLARDKDQVEESSKALKELGVAVDLARHFGFISSWKIIGPFDGPDMSGFERVHPPEAGIDLGAELDGKAGKVAWKGHSTGDPYGVVNLNIVLGRHKGAVAYALADLPSDQDRDVEIRLGCVTAWKLWIDGRPVFAHEEYHHGMEMDQFRVPARLQKGTNRILLKVCQNEQKEDHAQEWMFQLRVCDPTGTAVPTGRKERRL
jgi:hypothetical protein